MSLPTSAATGELVVTLYDRVVGTITPDRPVPGRRVDRAVFGYDPAALTASTRTPLSVRMPLTALPVAWKKVETFLAGLLPEDPAARREMARRLEVADEPLALLSRMGWDCPGAVQITPPERLTAMLGRQGGLEPVDERQIGARLVALNRPGAAWISPDEHWSLAGQQAKFALAADPDGRWAEATGSAPTTHIIKPGISHLHHQALVEHATMSAARAIGVEVATSDYTEFAGQPAIVVARFDRWRSTDGRVVRIHQEDMCQATGRMPEHKYEADGGPTAKDMATVLRTHAHTPAPELLKLADFLLINYAAAAPDGHAKNVSIRILPGGDVRMAPLYDLGTGLPYTRVHDTLALAIGGERRISDVHAKQWARAARDLSVDEEWLRARARQLVSDFPDALRDALDQIGTDAARELWRRTSSRLAAHAGQALRRLAEAPAAADSSRRSRSARRRATHPAPEPLADQ